MSLKSARLPSLRDKLESIKEKEIEREVKEVINEVEEVKNIKGRKIISKKGNKK